MPFVGGMKGMSILKAVSFSSLAVSFHADFGGADDAGDFLGHAEPESLQEHSHGGHEDHTHGEHHDEHGDHEDHAAHGEHDDHEDHEDHAAHGEHDDHEDLEGEAQGEHDDGEHFEDEMEAHADEMEGALEVAAPGLAGRERLGKMKVATEGSNGAAPGKPTEGVAPAVNKVAKSVAAASIMVSAASRLVEERTKELGLPPWAAFSASCFGSKPPMAMPPRPPRRKVEVAGRRQKDNILAPERLPTPSRHIDFAL